MFERIKSIWHDPVWSKVISVAIIAAAGALWGLHSQIALILSAARQDLTDTARYLSGTVQVHRWTLLLLLVGLLVFAVALAHAALWRMRKSVESARRTTLTAATEGASDGAPASFDPEGFEMTPLRSRALLALLGRVEARTTLYDLHEATMEFDYEGHHYVDKSQSRGRLQYDMDNAERLGIVDIQRRPGGASNCYELTAQGRNWVLQNETVLKAMAPVDMTQKARVRYT